MGGTATSSGAKLSSVELYNWQTNVYCTFTSLPYNISGLVATALPNGTQIFCGGETTTVQSKCFRLSNRTWIEVSHFLL